MEGDAPLVPEDLDEHGGDEQRPHDDVEEHLREWHTGYRAEAPHAPLSVPRQKKRGQRTLALPSASPSESPPLRSTETYPTTPTARWIGMHKGISTLWRRIIGVKSRPAE